MIGNVTWDDLLFPLHQINKKCENVILYAKNYLADKTDQNLNKRYHLFKNCIAEIEDMARKEIEKGLVLKYSTSNNWGFDDTASTPTIVETNFERQWVSAKRGVNNDGFDYISELYEKFEEEKTYYKLQMQVNGYEIDYNTTSLGVIAPQQLVDVEPKVATDKSYFEKSKQILAFIRSCENIPDDQNPLYDDIVDDRLRVMDKLPTLDDLEVEYFEHMKVIGQDGARDYITGLWTNSAPAPSLEYLYVADNRLRCIGLVWAKFIQDMVMFFNRIGVSEINLHNEDVALELLDKLSSLEAESFAEDKAPNIEAKNDVQINKDELLKCFNFKFAEFNLQMQLNSSS